MSWIGRDSIGSCSCQPEHGRTACISDLSYEEIVDHIKYVTAYSCQVWSNIDVVILALMLGLPQVPLIQRFSTERNHSV